MTWKEVHAVNPLLNDPALEMASLRPDHSFSRRRYFPGMLAVSPGPYMPGQCCSRPEVVFGHPLASLHIDV